MMPLFASPLCFSPCRRHTRHAIAAIGSSASSFFADVSLSPCFHFFSSFIVFFITLLPSFIAVEFSSFHADLFFFAATIRA